MKPIVVFTLALLCVASPARAQKVVLTVERLGCERGVDIRQVSARWLGRNTLEVVAYDGETPDWRVDAQSAWVHFDGAQLRLSYDQQQVTIAPDRSDGRPVDMACLFPVRLTFGVTGLRHARYQVWVTNGTSRKIDVDE